MAFTRSDQLDKASAFAVLVEASASTCRAVDSLNIVSAVAIVEAEHKTGCYSLESWNVPFDYPLPFFF